MKYQKTALVAAIGVLAIGAFVVQQSDEIQTHIADWTLTPIASEPVDASTDAQPAVTDVPASESDERVAADVAKPNFNSLLDLEAPPTTESYQCRDVGDEMLCGNFNDPNWIELLDDESLFQVGLTDPYAAYVASRRLTKSDPDRGFEYTLRSVAFSGKVRALLGNKQPKEGVEHTDELFAELEMHSAVVSQLYQEILTMNGHTRNRAAPQLYWDTYLAAHPERYEEMQSMLTEFKTFIDKERQTVMGENFFARAEQ